MTALPIFESTASVRNNVKRLWLLAMLIWGGASCVSQLSKKAKRVQWAESAAEVQLCQFISNVEGTSSQTGALASTGIVNARAEAIEEASALGATHILWVDAGSGWSSIHATAEAYNCDEGKLKDFPEADGERENAALHGKRAYQLYVEKKYEAAFDVTIWSAKSKLQYKAKVVAESLDDDLAVLQTIDTAPSIPAALSVNSIAPRLGENVFTVGFPEVQLLGSNAKFTEGSISGLSGLKDSRRLQISVPVQPGNSGGALVNEKGEAIGVIVSRMKDLTEFENVAFAINGTSLQAFIRSFQTATASPTRNRTAAIARAESAACGVIAIGQLSP